MLGNLEKNSKLPGRAAFEMTRKEGQAFSKENPKTLPPSQEQRRSRKLINAFVDILTNKSVDHNPEEELGELDF